MKKIFTIYAKSLPAYSLIETIVASVIFMIVFLIGMYTLTGLTKHDLTDADYLAMEVGLQKLRKEITLAAPFPAEQNYVYEWGEISVYIECYKDEVYRIELTAVSKKKHKTISYRFLQATPLKPS